MNEPILKAVAMPPRLFWAPLAPAILNLAIQFAAALALAAATLSGCDKSDGGNEVNGGSAGYFRYGDTETPVGKTFAVTDGGKVSWYWGVFH